MSFRNQVLATLTTEGQGHKELREKLDMRHSKSNISAALKELEDMGFAAREATPAPRKVGCTMDYKHRPRVLWKKVEA